MTAGNQSDDRPAAGKRWGGRFEQGTDPLVERYTESIAQDEALLPYDIAGSIAHARMLGRREIIDADEAGFIVAGLQAIAVDAERGAFQLQPELEDVHMNVEAELERRIGPAAGRLHTGRSRNDQVVTDFRLLVRETARELQRAILRFQRALLAVADVRFGVVMPGYTHLQPAQPVLLSHHLLAYVEMLRRDLRRFAAVEDAVSESPLGSGALAGLPYPLDREGVAAALGFRGVTANSMDAVSDRDFVIEFHAAASLCMMHLSRLSEELIIWSTREFGFITLADGFATGSSIMPQKKNPDVAELARGRTGQIYGNLVAALTLMKALPLTYNRDLQEDKPPLLASRETLLQTLEVFTALLPAITWHEQRLRSAATAGYSLATDIADYLTRKGLPFREAHHVVGRLVQYALAAEKDFPDLTLDEYRRFSELFEQDVLAISVDTAIDLRDVTGGTARPRVREQLDRSLRWVDEQMQRIEGGDEA